MRAAEHLRQLKSRRVHREMYHCVIMALRQNITSQTQARVRRNKHSDLLQVSGSSCAVKTSAWLPNLSDPLVSRTKNVNI